MAVDAFGAPFAHGRGERALELRQEVGIVGKVRAEECLFELDLGVREQHRELGRGQAEAGVVAIGELLVARQPFDGPVEMMRK